MLVVTDVGRPDFVGRLLVGPGYLVPALDNLVDDAGEPPLAPARLDAVADFERSRWAAPRPGGESGVFVSYHRIGDTRCADLSAQ